MLCVSLYKVKKKNNKKGRNKQNKRPKTIIIAMNAFLLTNV